MRAAMKSVVLLFLATLLMISLSACQTKLGNQIDSKMESQEEEQDMFGKTYTTKEIWCKNGSLNLYGVAYIPKTEEKVPLVIFSHELGNSHTTGIPYAKRLAEAGYAAYTFDFCGGSVGRSRSDGKNVGMSIMTEVSDLEAVLKEAATWDFVDPDRIILLGGSQGADVTAVAGCRNAEKIAGMMLMYPPLNAAESMHAMFPSKEAVPEEFDMFGGWIHVGRNYATDIWDLDIYAELAEYQGDVLLLHGDRDTTVDISVSEKAAEIIPNCEFYTIKGGGHEFFGRHLEDAIEHILAFMERYREAD